MTSSAEVTRSDGMSLRERVDRIFEKTLVWEDHCCVSFEETERFLPQLARFREAGFDLVHLNAGDSTDPFEHVMRRLKLFRNWIAGRPDQYVLALTLA